MTEPIRQPEMNTQNNNTTIETPKKKLQKQNVSQKLKQKKELKNITK